MSVDIQGTQAVAQAAKDANVERLFYVSHLGADRASAFPVLKAKAIAENYIRQSGVDYTILRSAVVFGPQDVFSTGLALLLHATPFFFVLPGDGSTLLQPLWVEDLVTCMTWALEDGETRNKIFELGGPEYLTFRQIVEAVMGTLGIQRQMVPLSPGYLRPLTVTLEHSFLHFPVSVFWLDYLATNRTCALDTLPRQFGLMPALFSQRLEHLKGQPWGRRLLKILYQRKGTR